MPHPPSFTPGRKWRIALNVVLSTLLLLAIAGMFNYIASRYYYRWTTNNSPLTAVTRQVVKSLTNDVKVIVFFDRHDPLFSSVSSLLNQYKLLSPQVQVEFVDFRYPGRAEQVRQKYSFTGENEANRIIFDFNNRVKVVQEKELYVYDYDGVFRGQEIRRTAFKGEQLFTSALYSVITGKRPKVYFLQGHGEHDPEDNNNFGFNRFVSLVRESNIEVIEWATLHQEEIPADCDLLVVAGPSQTFHPRELERVEKYLAAGGRLFLMNNVDTISRPTGIERLMQTYGIDIGQSIVSDSDQTQAGDSQLIVNRFGAHPIVTPLARSSLSMLVPRPVTPRKESAQSADAAKVATLASTSEMGIAIGNIRSDNRGTVEQRGEISLMVAAEKGNIVGVNADRGSTRLVVTGDSRFLSNLLIDIGSNHDFANLAINWLLSREILLSDIPPRAIEEYRLSLSKRQMRRFKWIFMGAVPGGVIAVGALVWLRRRF